MTPWKPALLDIKPFGREYDRDVQVESYSGGAHYSVNLYTYTCSCPDFTKRRAEKPMGDIARSCKHLRDVVLSLDIDAFGDELTRVIFKSKYGPYDRIWFAPGPDGEIVALGMTEGKPWWNLFMKQGPGHPYERFGFKPTEKKWAWNTAPPREKDMVRLMSTLPGIAED